MAGAVTYDETVSAAIRLIRSATNPSIKAVRKELGDRGSESTILKYLTLWRENLNETDLDVLPPSMPKELTAHIEGLWNAMGSIQEEGLAEEKRKARASVAQAVFEKEDAERVSSELQKRNEVLEAKIILGMDKIESYKRSIEDHRVTINEKNASLGQLESKLEQAEESKIQIRQHYEDRIQAIQIRNDEAVETIRAEHARETTALNNSLAVSVNRLRLEEERTNSQLDYWMLQIDEERTRSKMERTRSDETVKRLEEELVISRRREDAASVRLGSMELKVEKLEAGNEALQLSVSEKNDSYLHLSNKMSAAEISNMKLNDQIKDLTAWLKDHEVDAGQSPVTK